jgi:hypothetical protein
MAWEIADDRRVDQDHRVAVIIPMSCRQIRIRADLADTRWERDARLRGLDTDGLNFFHASTLDPILSKLLIKS